MLQKIKKSKEFPLKSLRTYLKAPKVRDFGNLTIGEYTNQEDIEPVIGAKTLDK
jgi:hypothetical protein